MHDQLEKVEQKQESYQDQVDLKMEVARFEAGYLDHAFSRFGNIREAAASLGMDSSTFVRKRQKYEQLGLMKARKRNNEKTLKLRFYSTKDCCLCILYRNICTDGSLYFKIAKYFVNLHNCKNTYNGV